MTKNDCKGFWFLWFLWFLCFLWFLYVFYSWNWQGTLMILPSQNKRFTSFSWFVEITFFMTSKGLGNLSLKSQVQDFKVVCILFSLCGRRLSTLLPDQQNPKKTNISQKCQNKAILRWESAKKSPSSARWELLTGVATNDFYSMG